ncbi:MAG TPA: 16S rRNA (uracil(1498)-N(3))-methyltransferase [Rhizomicrobium sp.]|jgi:16S rRNA (uracil1498-N3)-methyltransferase|nr:16S rRNA (uracil(1498)-N(3))-methyltransferase [Rhizomicrobium sp.]
MPQDLTEPGGGVRLHVDAPLLEKAPITPSDGQSHYLLNVMRARLGDRLRLFNGRDGEWQARVVEIGKRRCRLECERQTAAQREVPDIWLVFAPIKKTPADYLAQKATELGTRMLQPMITRRSIVRRVNTARIEANAVEAAEQSGRLTVPDVREPKAFEALIADWPANRQIVFCDEGGDAPPIAQALGTAGAAPCAIFTGPEGGFDPAERRALRELPQVLPVSLGERILRADTAALAALAVWQAIRGDWSRP